MLRLILASALTVMLCAAAAPAQKRPARAAKTREVKVYLVALEDQGKTGKKIGCGDSLVPVTRTVAATGAPLRAALEELLAAPREDGSSPVLRNYWHADGLRLRSVSLSRGTATIRLAGRVPVAGVCDAPRIESQITETARQFPTVRRVKVFLGRQTLANALR